MIFFFKSLVHQSCYKAVPNYGALIELLQRLSEKQTKFGKIFFMVWTFTKVNAQTKRKMFLDFVCCLEFSNFTDFIFDCQSSYEEK